MIYWGEKIIVACCLMGTVFAEGQPVSSRTPISAERVAQALVAGGVPATAGQIRFLSPVSASKQDFTLQLLRTARYSKNTAKAELRCHDRACLPFYVLLDGVATVDSQPRTSSDQGGAKTSAAEKDHLLSNSAKPILMRDGDKATLVFENTSLRISIPVICLQSGTRGQQIRVVTTDHKRFFKAEVVATGLLKATV